MHTIYKSLKYGTKKDDAIGIQLNEDEHKSKAMKFTINSTQCSKYDKLSVSLRQPGLK